MEILRGIKKYSKTDRIALICDGEKLSYKELEEYSNKIGLFLKENNGENTPVMIYGNKDNLIMACMMGALKKGSAYVPLDISFPVERVILVKEEVKPKILFNFSEEPKENFGKDIRVINKDELEEIIKNYKELKDEENWVKDNENAYILFTSGSTGKPKGVQISSNNLDNFVEWISKELNINGDEKVIMNQAAYSFDLSVTSIYLALTYGGTLFSLSKKTLANYKEMFNQFNKSKMNIWVSTPSFAGVCIAEDRFNSEMLEGLESMIFIGEVLPKNLAKELKDRFENTKVINGYGPTEATVAVALNEITEEMIASNESLPVGIPMETSRVEIVKEDGKKAKEEEKGEIIIKGKSVSKGYFNNEEKTNEVFFEEEGIKAYKTGDMAYFKEGKLYYCGRKDFQIKLNGFRIEIEDIENNLRKIENIKNAVVLPIYKNEKIAYLTGIIQLKEKSELSNLKYGIMVKKELGKLIPTYMVPRNIKILEELPTNINGKIDRKRLMEDM